MKLILNLVHMEGSCSWLKDWLLAYASNKGHLCRVVAMPGCIDEPLTVNISKMMLLVWLLGARLVRLV